MNGFKAILPLVAAAFLFPLLSADSASASPTAGQALALTPLQKDVNYDKPTPEEAKQCVLKPADAKDISGWVVTDAGGQILRRFLDSNGDNKIDLWCYYKNGIEIYRDIDSDFNERADQYRWLATGGTRWGVDEDEDGTIDRWKRISAEEVTEEVVAAIRTSDTQRFERLLPTASELKTVGLGADQIKDLTKRTAAARAGFVRYAQDQKIVGPKTEWIQFGASRPGILPKGTEGATKDLLLYDHTAAIIETDGKPGQLNIGSLFRIGDTWRVVDLPAKEAGDSFFYKTLQKEQQEEMTPGEGVSAELQEILANLETIDKKLANTPANEREKLHAERADLLEKLIQETKPSEDRTNWLRQYADTVSAAVQTGEFPDGLGRLEKALDRLLKERAEDALVSYLRFRLMTAKYGQDLQKPNADFPKIQEAWEEDLGDFVKKYPKSEQAAEAMLQLAIAMEFSGKESDAIKWYSRMASEFPDSPMAAKGSGAKRRLECVGKSIPLKGTALDGKSVDVRSLQGRVILVHYWATWCDPCKKDMEEMKSLQAKLARTGFTIIGVNLDSEKREAVDYVSKQRITWPQLFEDGGLEGRLAREMGILTLPTMLLIDKTGRVVRRNIHVGELEAEVKKLAQ